MDSRRFYVISPRGERGPFSVEELNAELAARRVTLLQQVRTGMGTMLGTVGDVVNTPDALWNPAETGSGLNAVAVAQRRTRMVSLVVLGLTLVPALSLMLLLGWGREEDTGGPATIPTPAAGTVHAPSVPLPPPPMSRAAPVMPATPPPALPTTVATPPPPLPPPRTETPTGSAVIHQAANGVLTLTASSATITSKGARLQGKDGDNPHIGSWNHRDGGVEWRVLVSRPGRFRVEMTYACNHSGAGAILKLAAGEAFINDTLQDSGSWDIFKPHLLAKQLTIASSGPVTITLSPQEKKGSAFMKLSGIVLTPVESPR